MAALLDLDKEALWLNPNIQDDQLLSSWLKPYIGEPLEKQRVSEAVNAVKNDSVALEKRLGTVVHTYKNNTVSCCYRTVIKNSEEMGVFMWRIKSKKRYNT